MHDSMGQVLTGVAVKSKGLALKLKSKSLPESKGALAISKLANQAIAQMRDLARMLYPVDIESRRPGDRSAIAVVQFRKDTGCPMSIPVRKICFHE